MATTIHDGEGSSEPIAEPIAEPPLPSSSGLPGHLSQRETGQNFKQESSYTDDGQQQERDHKGAVLDTQSNGRSSHTDSGAQDYPSQGVKHHQGELPALLLEADSPRESDAQSDDEGPLPSLVEPGPALGRDNQGASSAQIAQFSSSRVDPSRSEAEALPTSNDQDFRVLEDLNLQELGREQFPTAERELHEADPKAVTSPDLGTGEEASRPSLVLDEIDPPPGSSAADFDSKEDLRLGQSIMGSKADHARSIGNFPSNNVAADHARLEIAEAALEALSSEAAKLEQPAIGETRHLGLPSANAIDSLPTLVGQSVPLSNKDRPSNAANFLEVPTAGAELGIVRTADIGGLTEDPAPISPLSSDSDSAGQMKSLATAVQDLLKNMQE